MNVNMIPGLAAAAIAAALLPVMVAAQPNTSTRDGLLPAEVDERRQALMLDPSQVSAFVQEVDAAAPRLAVNTELPRIPASVTKLVTSMAALDILGPDYRWQTEVLIDGEVRDGGLVGDLFVKGYGDPYLTTEAYAALIRAPRASSTSTAMRSRRQLAAVALDALRHALGGSIEGRVLLGTVSADALPFHRAESLPLGGVIRTVPCPYWAATRVGNINAVVREERMPHIGKVSRGRPTVPTRRPR